MGVIDIAEPRATPRPEPDTDLAFTVFPAETEEIQLSVADGALVSEIPEDACNVSSPTELAPGVELLAFDLPDSVVEGGILHLSTWWRVSSQVDQNIMPAFRLSVEGQTPRSGTPWYTRHDAGDWTVPLSLLNPGQIVGDRYPARLAGLPAGTCEVRGVVIDTTRSEGNRILGEQRLLGEVNILPRKQE